MVTTLQDIQAHAAQPQGAQYRYDQLNRIKEMQVWQDMDVLNNQWQSSTALADYRTSYRYDANGNILNLNRNGHNSVHLAMDSLSYHYISGTNRLAYVDDAVASGNYSVDIDDQAVGNYAYDATGNLIKDVAEEIDSIVWTAYGKVLRVVRSSGSSKPDLHFAYGPDGNRLSKKAVYGNDSTVWTFYVRDAQGNTMATYRHKESSGVLHLTDHVMYGSSRLGSHERKHVELLGAGSSPITARAGIFGLERGDKRYELSNHLGNVLAVVSDRRAKASCADTLVSGYWADVISTSDYYPFGMGMVERGDDGKYRYGFNGMQRDDEWQGAGNAYDFGARMYDGRLGRFLGRDPLTRKYPGSAPFVGLNNNPLVYYDPDGMDIRNGCYNYDDNGTRIGLKPGYTEEIAQKIDDLILALHRDDEPLFNYVNTYDVQIVPGVIAKPRDELHYGHTTLEPFIKPVTYKNEAQRMMDQFGMDYWNKEREKAYEEDERNGNNEAFQAWEVRFNEAVNSGPVTTSVEGLVATITIDYDKIDSYKRRAFDMNEPTTSVLSTSTPEKTGKHELAHIFIFMEFTFPLGKEKWESFEDKEEDHARKIGKTYDGDESTTTPVSDYSYSD